MDSFKFAAERRKEVLRKADIALGNIVSMKAIKCNKTNNSEPFDLRKLNKHLLKT